MISGRADRKTGEEICVSSPVLFRLHLWRTALRFWQKILFLSAVSFYPAPVCHIRESGGGALYPPSAVSIRSGSILSILPDNPCLHREVTGGSAAFSFSVWS